MCYPALTIYLLAPSNLLFGILGAEPVPSGAVPMEGTYPINILLNRMPKTLILSLDIIDQGIWFSRNMDSVPLMAVSPVSPFCSLFTSG